MKEVEHHGQFLRCLCGVPCLQTCDNSSQWLSLLRSCDSLQWKQCIDRARVNQRETVTSFHHSRPVNSIFLQRLNLIASFYVIKHDISTFHSYFYIHKYLQVCVFQCTINNYVLQRTIIIYTFSKNFLHYFFKKSIMFIEILMKPNYDLV